MKLSSFYEFNQSKWDFVIFFFELKDNRVGEFPIIWKKLNLNAHPDVNANDLYGKKQTNKSIKKNTFFSSF